MMKHERLRKIEEYITENKYASVTELMEQFDISRATVRRDLLTLSEESSIICTRGGALIESNTRHELPYRAKEVSNRDEKLRLAERGAQELKAGDTVLIDTGTTLSCLANSIPNDQFLAATCDVKIAMELASKGNISVLMLGVGPIRKGYYNVTGFFCEQMIREYHFDKLFISCDAIDLQAGVTITNADEVSVKRAMLESSSESILLVDHTKFERLAFSKVCKVSAMTKIITGAELDDAIYRAYLDAGVAIERV